MDRKEEVDKKKRIEKKKIVKIVDKAAFVWLFNLFIILLCFYLVSPNKFLPPEARQRN